MNKNTILIVDDSQINLEIISDLLKNKYNLKISKNGRKAIDIALSDTPPDLILLDINMPEMDGYQVAKEISKNRTSEEIPIIFLTASTDPKNEVKGLKLGAVDYITKPIIPAVLRVRVETQLKLKQVSLLLKNQNQILEKKVKERTKELTNKNEMLENSLNENNLLLQEVHHRVGNNLQILSSILKLQNLNIEDKKVNDFISRYLDLINAFSIVHSELYKSDNYLNVDMAIYVKRLITYLQLKSSNNVSPVEVKTNYNNFSININWAIFSGLFLCEITDYLLNHLNDNNRMIEFVFAQNSDEYEFNILTTNLNIPEGFNFEKEKKSTFLISSIIMAQLNGTMQYIIDKDKKHNFIFRFKKEEGLTYRKP